MGILLKHVWRNIKSNFLRSILIILSIALAAAVFYVDLGIRKDVTSSVDQAIEERSYGYDIALLGINEPDSLILPEYDKKLSFRADELPLGEDKFLIFSGDLAPIVNEGLLRLGEKHSTYSPEAKEQVYLSRVKALYLGISLGEEIPLILDGKIRTFTFTAYVDDLGPFGENSERNVIHVFANGKEYEDNCLLLSLKDVKKTQDAIEQLRAQDASMSVSALIPLDDSSPLSGISELLVVLLALVMVIAFYIDRSAQSLIIDYRIPIFATFRSIGATKRATNGILVLENVAYSLLSSVIGVGLGVGFHNAILAYVGAKSVPLDITHALFTIAFSLVISVLVTLFSLFRVHNRSVKDLLFFKQISASKPRLLFTLFGCALLALAIALQIVNTSYDLPMLYVSLVACVAGGGLVLPGICALFSKYAAKLSLALSQKRTAPKGGGVWLGLRNLGVSKIDRSSAVLVAMVMALVFMIYIVVGSINVFFTEYANNYPYDIVIKRATDTEDTYAFLSEVEGVDEVCFEYWGYARPNIDGREDKICFVAVDGTSNGVVIEETYEKALAHDTTIVDQAYARLHGYTIGDTLSISYDGRNFDLTIVGYCESAIFNTNRSSIVMTREDFFSYVRTNPAMIGVRTKKDANEMKSLVIDALSTYKGYEHSVRFAHEIVDEELGETMDAVKTLTFLPVLAVLLALVGLVNDQLIAFNQKRKLYAVLYSTTMSRAQLKQTILTELTSCLFVGGVCGMILSVFLTNIVRDIVFVNLMYLPIIVSLNDVLLALLLLGILSILTAFFPLRRLKKIDIVQEIKYE